MNSTFAAALLSASLLAAAWTALAAELNPTNSAPRDLLLNNGLGQLAKVPTNAVPANLLPPPSIGLEYQVPQPTRGSRILEPVLQRQQEARQKLRNSRGEKTSVSHPRAAPDRCAT